MKSDIPSSSQNHPVGVLLINLGTPDSPTPAALRRYLKEFLWDPRLVDMFRPLWWLILNGIILNVRPRRSARAYAKVWTAEGSPLLAISKRQAAALEAELRLNSDTMLHVALGMRYGSPSIRDALEELRQKGCSRFILLPLYPQYSGTTTASAFDAIAEVFRSWRNIPELIPELIKVNNYHDNKNYIKELAASVQELWEADGEPDKKLIISFHGMPERYIEAGDPYRDQCEKTAELLAARLSLSSEKWLITFQSRFGRQEWLKPYTDKTLKELAQSGTKNVYVICPGFSADCLETLEEIKIQNRKLFLEAGGERYRYIPALNDRPGFIKTIAEICNNRLRGSGVRVDKIS